LTERFRVRVKRRAARALEELPREYQLKVLEVLETLEENPLPRQEYDLKKLRGFEGTFRIRLGGIRIVYSVDWASGTIIVHFIGPRSRAYKHTA